MRPLIPLKNEEEPYKENIEMPVVNELEPQAEPAPSMTKYKSDEDNREIRPIALRRSTRVVKLPSEW